MAIMNLNFSNVPSRDPLPEGVYSVEIAKVEEKLSKAGNPMLKVEFNVTSEGFEGRKLWAQYSLLEKAMWKVQELFKALGMEADDIVTCDTDDLIGLPCTAVVTQEDYEGTIQNRVKSVK